MRHMTALSVGAVRTHVQRSAQADAVLLGGSACFRTDGTLQLGVRKLTSLLRGLQYDNDWMPIPAPGRHEPWGAQGRGAASPGEVPLWLW